MEQNVPARKIPLSRGSLTGRHANFRGAGGIGFESSLERDFVTLMLFDPAVTSVAEQPVRIRYGDAAGKDRHYTPDYLVDRSDRPSALVEVKPSRFLTEDLEPKFRAGRHYAGRRGWTFEIWTEREIRTPLLENAKFLLPFRELKPMPNAQRRIASAIVKTRQATVACLIDQASRDDGERAESLSALWHLVATGAVTADLGSGLIRATR